LRTQSRCLISAQASKSELDSYYAQIKQIDNMLADPSAGLSPALQDFFKTVQDVASNPTASASRQSLLSAGEALAARFRSLNDRLEEVRDGVNTQITSSVSVINSYARQIARLNDSIENALGASSGQPPNDLLDKRDLLVADLSKEIKSIAVKQDGGAFNVFVGNGLPLVMGGQSYALQAAPSLTDPTRVEPFYASNGNLVALGEAGLTGARIGGLNEFRTETLEVAQNALGRVAIGLTGTFNAQHRLGQDINGNAGTDMFSVGAPLVNSNRGNAGSATISATITDVNALTTSNYQLTYDGADYVLKRLDDGATQTFGSLPQTFDGVNLAISGVPAPGDQFLIRPTANGAATVSQAITDIASIAAAAPIRTAAAATNTGTGTISAGVVDSGYLGSPLTGPVTISYSSGTNTLSGFPGGPVSFAAETEISFGGIRFSIAGVPSGGDTFTVSPNTGGVGDNRNALLLAGLQTTNKLSNGTANYQGAYGQLVSVVGNKTRELEVTSAAAEKVLSETVKLQQAESGVNLDEEAANLLRYQQAYQAAGKLMQTADRLFDVLLGLGE
jgi:flagellar hook-associated protein 1 FlgK